MFFWKNMNDYYKIFCMRKKITIRSEHDIRIAVNAVRILANSLSFSKVDLQKLIVAVSELTQNILDHTNEPGIFICESTDGKGIRIVVQDQGKGINELDQILEGENDFQKKGLGLGLVGAKRLLDDFQIETSEKGTKVIATKWKID
ncbi:ATP-binding protein [Alkalihalobacterium elongatum]|uniref:ATP-binding protein n=1 Tax=Alkalihalobacterium elongatum TaxID=2675466 RepID=UPI001F32E8C2|nr:ATP-binding protein [Alkalihalobacterium elongatum]